MPPIWKQLCDMVERDITAQGPTLWPWASCLTFPSPRDPNLLWWLNKRMGWNCFSNVRHHILFRPETLANHPGLVLALCIFLPSLRPALTSVSDPAITISTCKPAGVNSFFPPGFCLIMTEEYGSICSVWTSADDSQIQTPSCLFLFLKIHTDVKHRSHAPAHLVDTGTDSPFPEDLFKIVVCRANGFGRLRSGLPSK